MGEIGNYIEGTFQNPQLTELGNAADVIMEHFAALVGKDYTVEPTLEDIALFYTYYTAFTKFSAIKAVMNNSWSAEDTFPMSFDAFKEKVETAGWSFLKKVIGLDLKEWESGYEPSEDDGTSYYDDGEDYGYDEF